MADGEGQEMTAFDVLVGSIIGTLLLYVLDEITDRLFP